MLGSLALVAALSAPDDLQLGRWRAWLDSPGGELPFALFLEEEGGALTAAIGNGSERIAIPELHRGGQRITLKMPHYDSVLRAEVSADGLRMTGEWTKRTGAESWAQLPFHAEAGSTRRFLPRAGAGASRAGAVAPRYRVAFESDDAPAVGMFEVGADGAATGTFLTATGDYRWLAGDLSGDRLRLSCFDGAHAFLFEATVAEDGALAGEFWSRDSWHETWTATPDPDAALPDPFEETSWVAGTSLAGLVLPDVDGRARSLADPAFDGRVRLLQVFGTWCPNCHDETAFLVELHERYRDRGLSIVGLAFELTGDARRDAEQVRVFAERFGAEWPILVAGLADKATATEQLPLLDRVRSYPTTIFLDAQDRVRHVHTGWTGPATGDAHDEVRAEFVALVEGLLAEEPPSSAETTAWLTGRDWRVPALGEGRRVRFVDDGGALRMVDPDEPDARRDDALEVSVRGDALRVGDEVWRIDRAARVVLHARDAWARMVPDGAELDRTPLLTELELELADALRHDDAIVRREAIHAVVHDGSADEGLWALVFEALGDDDVDVRRYATRAHRWSPDFDGLARDSLLANALFQASGDPHPLVRREAAVVMLDAPTVFRDRLGVLRATDPHPLVREAAGFNPR